MQHFSLILATLALFLDSAASSLSQVTMGGYSDYQDLRPCAKSCLCCQMGALNLLGNGFDCPGPWYNDCFCPTRTDLVTIGPPWLSSCISSSCTIGSPDPDITSAIAVWETCCLTNGYTLPGLAVVTPGSTPTVAQAPLTTETVISGSSTLTITLTLGVFVIPDLMSMISRATFLSLGSILRCHSFF